MAIKNGNYKVYNGVDFDTINLTTVASNISIADAGSIITATDVEGALQEVTAKANTKMAKTADSALNMNSYAITGASAITANGTITSTNQSDGAVLINLNTERAWNFLQKGTAGSTELWLQPTTDGKTFRIATIDGAHSFGVTCTNGVKPNVTIDNNRVLTTVDQAINDTHIADLITDADGAHGLRVYTGTFTPTLVGTTGTNVHTYSVQNGYYYRIGNLVKCSLYVGISAKDATMAGAMYVGGLPFVSQNVSYKNTSVAIGNVHSINFASGYTQMTGQIPINSALVSLKFAGTGVGAGTVLGSDIMNTSTLMITFEYEV